MKLLGVDPGKKGALVVLEFENGEAKGAWPLPMPLIGKAIDLHGIVGWLRDVIPYGPLSDCLSYAVIEKVWRNPKWGTRNFDFGYSAGSMEGLMVGLGIRFRRVHPSIWKKVVLAGTKKDKSAAIEYVKNAYSKEVLLPGKYKKPHEGIADAICIAEWGWRTFRKGG